MSFFNEQKQKINISQVIVIVLIVHLFSMASFAQAPPIVTGSILNSQTRSSQKNSLNGVPASSGSTLNTNSVLGTSTTKAITNIEKKSDFGLALAIEYSQAVVEDELGSRESGTDFDIRPSFKINDLFTTTGRLIVSKSNNGPGDTTISDTTLGLSMTGYKLTDSLTSLHSISTILPTSEKSKETDRLQAAFSVSNGLRYQAGLFKMDYRLGLNKNVHEFNLNADGSPNIEYRIANSAEVQINITDKFYITALGIYRWGRTYGGKERLTFESHGDLGLDVSDKLSLNLGTSNVGSALKANGIDSNISAFDEDTSVFRAGISLIL